MHLPYGLESPVASQVLKIWKRSRTCGNIRWVHEGVELKHCNSEGGIIPFPLACAIRGNATSLQCLSHSVNVKLNGILLSCFGDLLHSLHCFKSTYPVRHQMYLCHTQSGKFYTVQMHISTAIDLQIRVEMLLMSDGSPEQISKIVVRKRSSEWQSRTAVQNDSQEQQYRTAWPSRTAVKNGNPVQQSRVSVKNSHP